MIGPDHRGTATVAPASPPEPEPEPGPDAGSAGEAGGRADRPRPGRRMPRGPRIALAVVLALTVVEAVAFGGTYVLYSRHYVSTPNAQVDGDELRVNAPATGILRDWTAARGRSVRPNEVLGRIELQGADGGPLRVIRSPGAGTVALDDAVDGQWVTEGAQLAAAYDLDRVYLTARVKDTDVAGVRVGARAEVTVDAFPHVPMSGTVVEIQSSAAGQFTVYPSPDEDPSNPQKVDQYVPVKIALTGTGGARLVPGMSAEVHIHRD